MKRYNQITASWLAAIVLALTFPASAGETRSFGFTGEVNALDRGNGTMIVEDMLFRIDKHTRVHKRKGRKGTLSDIRPGVKIGFYPRGYGHQAQSAVIDQVWILPRNWRGESGYAETADE